MRLALACAVSAAVVLTSPFMGQVQGALRAAVSTRTYVLLLGISVAAAILLAGVVAFRRIRARRGLRLAAMAAAVAIGAAYTSAMSAGDAAIDAVERVHFVEYGVIAILFYRVWRRVGDPSTLVLPLLFGVLAGTLDEWLQWFIPYRVGEAHDVFLNLTSLVCGVLFGIALEPPPAFSWRPRPGSLTRVGLAAAGVLLAFAGFVHSVHLGRDLHAEGIGRFMSRYTIEELDEVQRVRDVRWRTNPPVAIVRLSREDQYLDEGLWHVRQRNRLWAAGDVTSAWHENLILERFFAPVLDRPTYASPTGTRWPPEHRADAAARATPSASFISVAEPRPMLTWPKPAFWSVVGLALLVIAGMTRLLDRRRSASGSVHLL
jgi:hypothetical protein